MPVMSSNEVIAPAETTSPAVPEDIASRILAGFQRGELPSWMKRTSYNSAVLKIGLADGKTVSITAPSQRLAEAKESTSDAWLELIMKKAAGEKVDDATLEEARTRAGRAAVDYMAGVITEFGPAIKLERPLIVGEEVLFEQGTAIPPLSTVPLHFTNFDSWRNVSPVQSNFSSKRAISVVVRWAPIRSMRRTATSLFSRLREETASTTRWTS